MANGRPQPHLSIPPRTRPLSNPSLATDSWNFLVTPPPDRDPLNLWADDPQRSSFGLASPDSTYPFDPSFPEPDTSLFERPPSRAASAYESSGAYHGYPEPHLYRSTSHRASLRPSISQRSLGHRHARSEVQLTSSPSVVRGESRPPSFIGSDESSPESTVAVLSDELSSLTFASEEGLRKFQMGSLPESDEAWHRLVPPEAREVLDKKEVLRQSVIFEVIKSERDYVQDLELVKDVYISPLLNLPVISRSRLQGFLSEVFYNLDEILAHHRRLLDQLFERQREQHPLIQSIADIILETSLQFRQSYEAYIKHYPLAEARHRTELRRNPKYQSFLSQCGHHPRVRKRDLNTFITRPVTRLPRLTLLLSTMQGYTAADHPDQETLPLILSLLTQFVKSTQPGIEAAESKVQFYALCESLVYQKGEIIDLDLFDESRSLLHLGPLARRYRADVGYHWADLNVALLDNYLLLLKPERRSGGEIRHVVVSRPIPLEYLCLSNFNSPTEPRKEKNNSIDQQQPQSSRSLLSSFSIRSTYRQMYPFTVHHATSKMTRRYTLYAASEEERDKWRVALVEAIALRKVRQDANMWFAPHTINEGFFRMPPLGGQIHSSNGVRHFTGRIRCAVPFSSGGKNLIAVGCPTGVYVAVRGQSSQFRKVLQLPNPTSLHTIPSHNKFLVHCDSGLKAYSLDLLARVAMHTSPPQPLDASRENITAADDLVLFVKVGRFAGKILVLYATKGLWQVQLHIVTPLLPDEAQPPKRRSISGLLTFKPYLKDPISIPKDVHDLTPLRRKIGICAERGIHIFDPEHLTTNYTIIPNFLTEESNPPMQLLKQRCSGAKPLGLVKSGEDELLVVFDGIPRIQSSQVFIPCTKKIQLF
ncbi:unnamed protein product [Somion occarium]|uniref:Rho1 guanine nucleotide exchange factor 1 n=1 Tax=Somion occarium TaxID=3059160 RepID=A0ABP1EAJ2_9APHY